MADGDVMLDASGNVILDASGNELLDNGTGCTSCCGTPPPPSRWTPGRSCSTGNIVAGVWLGIEPAMGETLYRRLAGVCYTFHRNDTVDTGGPESGFESVTVTDCGNQACVPCNNCGVDPAESPASFTVTLANVVVCTGCQENGLSCGGLLYITGHPNGTYTVPKVDTCTWRGLHSINWRYETRTFECAPYDCFDPIIEGPINIDIHKLGAHQFRAIVKWPGVHGTPLFDAFFLVDSGKCRITASPPDEAPASVCSPPGSFWSPRYFDNQTTKPTLAISAD